MAAEVEILLTQHTVQVAADGPVLEVTAVVRNLSSLVDQYTVDLEGLAPAWYEVVPSSVSLFPGDEATVTVRLHPPAGSVAGTHDCRLRAVSGDNPLRLAAADLAVAVGTAGGIAIALDPERVVGRVGQHNVTLSSYRNDEAPVTLAGIDQEEALSYQFTPAALVVPPFGEVVCALQVRPKSRRLWGQTHAYAFTVQALSEGEELAAADCAGALEYRPLLGTFALPAGRWRWLLALIPVLALALLVRSLMDAAGTEGARASMQATATALAAVAPPGEGSVQTAPRISLLAARQISDELPRGVAVSWDVERGDSAAGQLRGVDYGPAGEPSRKGEYWLEASGQGVVVSDSVQVVTLGPPIIKKYFATPSRGGGSIGVQWQVEGADAVDVEGKSVDPANGAMTLAALPPAGPGGGYILRASNSVGMVSSILYLVGEYTPTPLPVPSSTATASPTPTGTSTATATATSTAVATSTSTPVSTPTNTAIAATPTYTPAPPTPTSTRSATPTRAPTSVPVAIPKFGVSSSCIQPSRVPDVTVSWLATGGSDAWVSLYRNSYALDGRLLGRTTLVNKSTALSNTFREKPPYSATTRINYTLTINNAAGGSVSRTEPATSIFAYCLY